MLSSLGIRVGNSVCIDLIEWYADRIDWNSIDFFSQQGINNSIYAKVKADYKGKNNRYYEQYVQMNTESGYGLRKVAGVET